MNCFKATKSKIQSLQKEMMANSSYRARYQPLSCPPNPSTPKKTHKHTHTKKKKIGANDATHGHEVLIREGS